MIEELEARRKELTLHVLEQKKAEELRKKKKAKEANEVTEGLEKSQSELRDIMRRLEEEKAAAEREKAERKRTAGESGAQLDNAVVYVEGEYSLVLRADGSAAYTVRQEGTAEIGETVFEADLRPLERLAPEIQRRLVDGYLASEARGGQRNNEEA